ncbi:MAG: ATP-binding protein, partial [Bacteroidota bacterium]
SMNVIDPGIIQDISLLYELSLSIGKSQSLEENCQHFLTTMMRRTNLDTAVVWVKSSYQTFLASDEDTYEYVYGQPQVKVCHHNLLPLHPIVQRLKEEKAFVVTKDVDDFHFYSAGHKQAKGKIAIFKLGNVGILSLHGRGNSRFFQPSWQVKIQGVFAQFAQSLEGNLAHRRLIWEIEERKVMEVQLLQSKEAEEQFFANMSHEIRTPLNGMLGMMNLVLGTDLTGEQREYINDMKVASKTLLAILNDILDYSKIKQGKIDIERIKFEIKDNLRSLYHIARAKAKEKGVRANLVLDVDTPRYVMGDPVRLNQILENLINNALKFTEVGEINIRMRLMEERTENLMMEFQVQDTGIGIPEEKQAAIFEHFTQAGPDTTRKFGGTGLGLAIVRQLLELMGGSIHLESQVGVGSAFTFTLPFGVADQHAISENAQKYLQAPPKEDLSGHHILVVEDTYMNQKVIQRMLEKWGAEVAIASNGSVAFEMMQNHVYDLVLMDVHMPVMDGYEATELIRGHLPSSISRIPIIALTASVRGTVKRRVLEVGMDGYIIKPFEPRSLYKMIRFYLNKRKPQEVGVTDYPSTTELQLKAIDTSYLVELSGGDKEFVREMMAVFLEQTPIDLDYLEKSIKSEEWQVISQQAHKLKYPFSSMGRNDLRLVLADIELQAKKEVDIEGIQKLFDHLSAETRKMLHVLKQQ